MGKRKSVVRNLVDDDDQHVLAVTGLGSTQLAGLNSLGGVSNFSSNQTLYHNARLQVCVLLGILGLDQSNTVKSFIGSFRTCFSRHIWYADNCNQL